MPINSNVNHDLDSVTSCHYLQLETDSVVQFQGGEDYKKQIFPYWTLSVQWSSRLDNFICFSFLLLSEYKSIKLSSFLHSQ